MISFTSYICHHGTHGDLRPNLRGVLRRGGSFEEKGGSSFFGFENRRSSAIFDLRTRRSKNSPSSLSIFGAEYRRTPIFWLPMMPLSRTLFTVAHARVPSNKSSGEMLVYNDTEGSSTMSPKCSCTNKMVTY